MARAKTIKNVFDKKDKTFLFDGVWADTMGDPETYGAWLFYGHEKNGKTWLALKAGEYLSKFEKILYVSAEEGTGANFKKVCKRAHLNPKNKKLQFLEYISIEELSIKLKKQRAAKIVFIDNMTVYNNELKNGGLQRLLDNHPNVLFIFLAHEKNNEPFTAAAQLCKILAKVIVRVEGLACEVSGRCPGGRLIIDEEKAMLYHGSEVRNG